MLCLELKFSDLFFGFLFCGDPVRGFALGDTDLAGFFRFHQCCLPLGRTCCVGLRRSAQLFQLGLLCLGGRLKTLCVTWHCTRHSFFDPFNV